MSSDDPQNPIPEENPAPASPQDPTPPAPIPPSTSEPAEVPPEAPEAPRNDADPSLGKDPNGAVNTTESQVPEAKKEPEIPQTQAPTAQIPPSEPLARHPIRELLAKANSLIQSRKRKKIDRILDLFAKRTNITNDKVEKLLHVSDATATRYLSQLEKEGKIKQSGRTGKGVVYTKL